MSVKAVLRLLASSVVTTLGLVVAPTAVHADNRHVDIASRPTLRQFALDHNGGSLDWVPGTGIDKSAWARAVRDNTIRVDANGDAFVVESAANYPSAADVASAGTPIEHSTIPLANAFLLHSDPTARRVIYLDFTGMNISGTAWAYSYGLTGTQTEFGAYDIDGDPSTFSATERQNIIDTWSAVAEDFAPFDVDVTTVEPNQSLIDRSSATDQYFGTRALITSGPNAIYDSCGCGGIAYVGTFDSYGVSSGWYNPAFAFASSWFNGKIISDIVSHEVGHNLGLSHDGYGSDGYYLGRNGWAPIMGAGYYEPLVQWSNGDYDMANQTQNDFAVMESNGAPYFADDAGDTRSAATLVDATSTTNGLVGTRTDVDWYRFVATKYAHTIAVSSPSISSNLDVQLTVTDSNGSVIASSNPTMSRSDNYSLTGLDASVIVNVIPGSTYYVSIDGTGQGNSATGYSDYGSVGQYVLDIAPGPLPDMIPGTVSISGTGVFGSDISGSAGSWPVGATVTTEWLRNGVGTGDTDSTYTPTTSDIGAAIAFRVTATKPDFNTAVVTSSPLTVSRATLTLTPSPSISGDATAGSTLTVSPGTWDSGVSLEVTWLRNGSATSNHSLDYTIGADDLGATLSARVSGTKPGYTSVTRTSSTVLVVAATISPTSTPTLVGVAKVGKTLTVTTGTWMSDVSFSYRWNRNGVAIPGATGTSYRLTRKDDGKRITVTLTATRSGYTTVTVTSLPTRRVAS